MTHHRHVEDAGAYLLGALSEFERQAFEHHLESCDECRRDVEQLRPAAAALPRTATPLDPPPQLKASLMQVIEREGGQDRQASPSRRRPFISWRLPAAAWASAVVLIAVGLAGGFGLSRALDDGGSRTLAAKVNPTKLPRAKAKLVVPEDGRTAVLRATGMPRLAEDAVYQVWLARRGKVISQSLFQVGPDGSGAAAVPDALAGADAVMVTREPASGSPAPTEKPVLAVEL